MDNKSDDQFLVVQYMIDANSQDYDEETKKLTEYLTGMIASLMDQIKTSKHSPEKRGIPTPG